MKSYLFATYSDKEYIPYLKCCLEGCWKFFHERPVVFAFDQETAEFGLNNNCQTRMLNGNRNEKQVASLQILLQAETDFVIMIDADCWPLTPLNIAELVTTLEQSQCSAMGDVGKIDIPYLFKSVARDDLFLHIHNTLNRFPIFSEKWLSSPIVSSTRYSTGCVVDLPLLYGGFAIYKKNDFLGLDIPEWIHSADIWLSMYAVNNNLKFLKWKQFQFNRNIDEHNFFFHLAGPKPDECEINIYMQKYKSFLNKLK